MTYNKDLERFLEPQESDYQKALAEIRAGRKRSHWMWYIFPQLQSLGRTRTALYYGIRDLQEAQDYLKHPVLGARLREISMAILELPGNDPHKVLGSPDDLKLRSCMTLFAAVDDADPVFQKVLDKYYGGEKDELSLELIKI